MNVISKPLERFAGFTSTNKYTSAITQGIAISIPVTIVGGLATLITAAPSPDILAEGNIFRGILVAWKALAGSPIGQFAGMVNNVTMNLIAVYCLIAITYYLANTMKIDKLSNCVTSVMIFLMIGCEFKDGTLSMDFLGGKGLFCAMFVACVSVSITKFLLDKNIKIRLPDAVPPNVSAPFEQLIPMLINLVVFFALNLLCTTATGVVIPQFILNIFKPILSASDSLPAMLIYVFLLNALWVIGINGGNIVNSVMSSVLLVNLAENAEAAAAGLALPHTFVYTPNNQMMNIGGSGAAFALVIAALIVARSNRLKAITKLGGIGTIFNISEPIVYGYPIVLNTFLFIPFIIVPIINTVVFYILMNIGFLGKVFINVPWVIPTPIQLALATMDIKAAFVWIVMIVVDVLLYIPFVKAYDNHLCKEESAEGASV